MLKLRKSKKNRSATCTLSAAALSLAALAGCVTTTNDEARVEFAQKMREHGRNPFIEVPVFKDLERRIRKIAVTSEDGVAPTEFNARQMALLSNFQDQYDHRELKTNLYLARAGFVAAVAYKYPVIGTESGCKIDTADARFPRDTDQTRATFNWRFVRGECRDGVAHGIGRARAGSNSNFVGRFDNGEMVEGIFETTNTKGERVFAIGEVPATDFIGRMLISAFRKSGFQWHRLGDFDGNSKVQGFFINIFAYTDGMTVRSVGTLKDHNMHGFGAEQIKKRWGDGDGKIWNTWIGTYRNGKLEGPGAWTNNANELTVGEWRRYRLNGGAYTQYNDPFGDYHMFDAGNYVNGKRHGMFKVFHSNTFNSGEHAWERYNHGEMVDASYNQNAFTLSQVLAFSMGAAIISASDASSAAKIQIGTALAQDTLGGGGGSNLAALQRSYLNNARSGGGSGGGTGQVAQGGGASGIKLDTVTISCPQTGVSKTMQIPYRTNACRRAAINLAKVYSCNQLNQATAMQNCSSACGHPTCQQQ